MIRILGAEEMRWFDRAAIDDVGVPALVLMENAALGVVDALSQAFPEARSAVILAGPGNNGGDGLAVARHLAVRGFEVSIVLATAGRTLAGDAALQLEICRALDLPISELREESEVGTVLASLAGTGVVVDALFGTGLSRPLEGLYAALVEGVNRLAAPVVAADLASGLAGGNAEIFGPHVRADLTVTFALPKVAHVFPPASEAAGELAVADLGVPVALADALSGPRLELVTADDVATALPARRPSGHKGTYGHVLVVAGGPGGVGAAVLAARAAVRSGAGLVTLAVPKPWAAVADAGCLESITLALPADGSGALATEAGAEILRAAEGKTVLALGPGLGRGAATEAAIREVVEGCGLPMVLDADALNAYEGRPEALAGQVEGSVLTPHPGEIGRLLGSSLPKRARDRLVAARTAAADTGAVVLLKGHRSLVAGPGGDVAVNPTGNPGMGSGGSGDVLTGMIAGLMAQGLESRMAAFSAAYLHGLAGDRAAARLGLAPLAASDLLVELPGALAECSGRPLGP